VVLPAAAFAEKEGTFTSVERRIQRLQAALSPKGECRTDLEIMKSLAEALGKPLPYEGPAEVLEEIGAAIPIYSGIRMEAVPEWGLCWPLSGNEDAAGTPVLYEESFPQGKAQLDLEAWKEISASGDAGEYPFILHPQTLWFHSGTFSTWSPTIMEVCPEPVVILHQDDAREQDLKQGDSARITSPRGSMDARIDIRPRGPRGVIQVPHHFPTQALNPLIGWDDAIVRVRVERV
jgi:predicted molibdopterin-dependent oxidoreductase YjgC